MVFYSGNKVRLFIFCKIQVRMFEGRNIDGFVDIAFGELSRTQNRSCADN
jgi:hypothetical protein